MNKTDDCGPSHARNSTVRQITVWDPLVRIIHWTVALAILLNVTIVDEDSALHLWLGYGALGLVLVRLGWGWIGSKYARFSAFPPNIPAALRHLNSLFKSDKPVHLSHNPLGALMAYNIWASILVISATGFMMGTNRFFGVEWVEEVHEAVFVWLMISVFVHVAGVILETKLSKVPLVKAMITGKKDIPEHRNLND